MIDTLTTGECVSRLYNDENAGWSYEGAQALVAYLEELEEDMGEPIEFDKVAIRIDYSEYASALEAATEFGFEADEDEDEDERKESALAWLQDRTQVIEFEGGVVVAAF
jgi:hypothetical protein